DGPAEDSLVGVLEVPVLADSVFPLPSTVGDGQGLGDSGHGQDQAPPLRAVRVAQHAKVGQEVGKLPYALGERVAGTVENLGQLLAGLFGLGDLLGILAVVPPQGPIERPAVRKLGVLSVHDGVDEALEGAVDVVAGS